MWWIIVFGVFFVVPICLLARRDKGEWELLLTPDGLVQFRELEAATQAVLAEIRADGLTEAEFAELCAEFRADALTEAEFAELCVEFRAAGVTEGQVAELRRVFIRR